MRVDFRVHYQTAMGRRLQIVLDGAFHDLEWHGDGWWGGAVDIDVSGRYTYRIVADGAQPTAEPGPLRPIGPDWHEGAIVVDRWREPDPTRLARRSTFFKRSRRARYPSEETVGPGRVRFELLEPWIPEGKVPAIVGSAEQLGSWNPEAAVAMVAGPYPMWTASLDTPADGAEYKFVLLDEAGRVERWEQGPNRILPPAAGAPLIVHDEELRGVPPWRGAGVAVPVFALRSAAGVGVGQFTDLIPFADWAAGAGFSMIQLLPVNDTILHHDWDDSYPYNPVSVQALHPLYIDLEAIAGAGISDEIAVARAELNDLAEIDYPLVMERKMQLLQLAYENLADALDTDVEFADFVDEQWDWLGPYSAWSMYRDRYGTPDFTLWNGSVKLHHEQLERDASPDADTYDELCFHWFVQFHLHRQLNLAAEHVRRRGIALKGDLPIGVAPHSAEVWARPELFHVGAQTGAPPDAFSQRGQNWGFPTYNWDLMAADDFAWWRSRFKALAAYVDAYRIDHILGFFRIWEIPASGYDGTVGHFRPSLPLAADEIRSVLGDVDIAALTRPRVDVEGDADAALEVVTSTQADIRAAFATAAFSDLGAVERAELERRVLDIVADVLLIEVDGGYAPAISWRDATHYKMLHLEQQEAFDALAIDFFHHRHSVLWERQGRRTLPALLAATDLLACGEDLGMVPDLVPRVMNEMGLLGLEIERMPKRLGEWIADPAAAPYLSVVSPGTHDTPTLRQWWEEDRELIRRYWQEALGETGEPPEEATPEVVTKILQRQLASPAMLCIIPIADLFAIEPGLRRFDIVSERINDPANRHNRWRYRIDLTIDELAGSAEFNARLRALITAAGRAS